MLWMGGQLGLSAADGGAGRAASGGWIQKDAARALFTAAGLDFAATSAAAARAGFKAVPMGLHADVTLHNSVRLFTSANVIAQLSGGSRHREYVVYTAHWDHLGRDPARPGHNIFNGAIDNASGVAGLPSLAQALVGTQAAAGPSILVLVLD